METIKSIARPIAKPEIEAASETHSLTATNPDVAGEYQDLSIVLQDLDDKHLERPLITLELETNDVSLEFIQAVIRQYFPGRNLAIVDLD